MAILKNAIICLTFALGAFGVVVLADTPRPLVKFGPAVRDLKVTPDFDARGRDLRGTKLIGQNLGNANFRNCDLGGVVIEDCNLFAADFSGATLRHAHILDCKISRANFSGATVNGLGDGSHGGNVLSDAQLRTTKSFKDGNLSESHIQVSPGQSMDFRGMNMRGAIFYRGDFSKCKFENADLSGAYFGACNFSSVELNKAKTLNFKDCHIKARFVDEADFTNQDLSGARISWVAPSVKLDGAIINGCHLFRKSVPKQAIKQTKSYQDGDLVRVAFYRMDLKDFDLRRQNLSHCIFAHTDVENSEFSNAVITGADLSGALNLTSDQIRSTWNFKHDRMASVFLAKDIREELNLK